jgi:hypothetical protein
MSLAAPCHLCPGDWLTVPDGLFAGLDAQVLEVVRVCPAVGRARVRLPLFGRGGADLEHWQPYWAAPLTEAGWLADRDTAGLERFLARLPRPPSARKWRLFACACARRVWHRLPDELAREAVEVAERYADGRASWGALRGAATRTARRKFADWRGEAAATAAWAAAAPGTEAGLARRAALRAAQDRDEAERQRALLRDVFANPFRPVRVDPAWLAWDNGCVARLAREVYEGRCFAELPVLADALEEAGCGDEFLLGHCRGGGEHARGCWAVDALLGRE